MKTRNNFAIVAVAVIAVLFMAALSFLVPMSPAPVQAAVLTPVSSAATRGGEVPRVAEFFGGWSITQDTRTCFEMPEYEVMDIQYLIDQGTVNTVTLTLQNSNISGTYNDANAVVTNNAADANGMLATVPLYGRYTCVYANVTNANPLTLTVVGLGK